MTDSQSFVERFNQQNPPHKAHRTRRAQGVHGHVLSGAYLHLEVEDAEKTEAWVEQQNERTATFTGVKTSTKPKAAKPNEVKKSGYTLLKGNKPSGENYKINLSALGLPENAQLSFRSWNAAENKCAIGFSLGGSDKHILAVYDEDKQGISFVDKRYYDDEAPLWVNEGNAIRYFGIIDPKGWGLKQADLQPKEVTTALLPTTHKELSVRATPMDIKNIEGGLPAHEYVSYTKGTESRTAVYLRAYRSNDTFCKLFDDGVSELIPLGEVGGKLYALTNLDAPKRRVVAIDYDNPAPEYWQDIVPERQDRLENVVLDGSAAVLMSGYGGFDVSCTPVLSDELYDWVSQGGVYVNTNLRGGGEFGQAWYDGGRLENKQNVFDDFAACAEHLIANNYTSAKRLAITGGSNGGLLTLATSLQRPELFGAVIADVAVADMAREKHWSSDYGDRENNCDAFATAMRYSPVHNIKPGKKYAPTMVMTGDCDDRVKPGLHSYKFVATMQETSPESLCLLHVQKDSGHSGPSSFDERKADTQRRTSFIEKCIGPIDQRRFVRLNKSEKSSPAWVDAVKTGVKEHARAFSRSGGGISF